MLIAAPRRSRTGVCLALAGMLLLLAIFPVSPTAYARSKGFDHRIVAQAAVAPAVSGTQKWLTILCKFQDVVLDPKPKLYFQGMYTDTRGLDAYWREVSYNTINLAGSRVVGWYTLPQPRSFYVVNGHQDMDKTRADCTAAADLDVNFPDYAGITMMFNAHLDTYFGITQFNSVTLDGVTKTYPFIWIDDQGSYNEALTAHEMGHALGLFGHPFAVDSAGTPIDADRWDLLGGTCSYALIDPIYSCIPVHVVAPSKDLLGWIPPARAFSATIGTSATITLEQLAQPGLSNYLIAKIPIDGSSTHYYTVEARRKVGFDNTPRVPSSAVLIHEVDTVNFGANHHLISADPASKQPGGAGAIWAPGKTFSDSARNISVTVVAETASGFVVRIQNAPVGVQRKLFLAMIVR